VIAGCDLDFKNIFGATGFMKACYYGRYEIVEYLLQFNVDVNTQDNIGRTALMEGTNSN
jgi:ankyrin repeat protein